MNTTDYAKLLDLGPIADSVRIKEGPRGHADWYDSYDTDSGAPAIAWVTWASREDGVTDEGFDYDGLDMFLATIDDNPDVDHDYGISVILCPEWLHFHAHQLLAA